MKFKVNPNRKTITIPVKKWCRHNFENENGNCCALGWAGKQLYDNSNAVFNRYTPLLAFRNQIINANDHLWGKERRTELRKLFKAAGYKLRFIE